LLILIVIGAKQIVLSCFIISALLSV
jgi:hypothetical protein